MSATEYVILVNQHNEAIGVEEKLLAHRKNLLHRAFSIFLFSAQDELLLQQRALGKYHSPGLWTNTCCSHPRFNEEVIAAGQRRLQEELGVTTTLTDLGWFHYNAHFDNGLSENEIDHVLIGKLIDKESISPNKQEVHAIRWIKLDDLRVELKAHPQKFTPWLQLALDVIK